MEIGNFLATLEREGALESSGNQFTVDLRAQAAKMARYQSEQPALFLLKAVQAAVLSQAPDVHIKLSRDHIGVVFEPATDLWLEPMEIALQAALSQNPAALTFRHGRALFVHGQEMAAPGAGVQLILKRKTSFWDFSDGRFIGRIHCDLAARLALCPIAVFVDGRRINTGVPEKLAPLRASKAPTDWTEGAVPYHWLAERVWVANAGPFLALANPAIRQSAELVLPAARTEGDVPEAVSVAKHIDLDREIQSATVLAYEAAPSQWQREFSIVWHFKGEFYPGALTRVDWQSSLPIRIHVRAVEADESRRHGEFVERVDYLAGCPDTLTPFCLPYRSKVDLPLLKCRRWLGIAWKPGEGTGIFYLQHGVLLDPVVVPGHAVALIADTPVETDLSQLRVVRNRAVEADVEWLQAETETLIAGVQPHVLVPAIGEKSRVPLSMRQAWRKALK